MNIMKRYSDIEMQNLNKKYKEEKTDNFVQPHNYNLMSKFFVLF